MAIEIINVVELGKQEKKRTKVMTTRKMHAWVHYYPNPGDHDEMHCHNQDQTFICFEGQCTMHFPDGGKEVLDPGMASLITGGSFYQLENPGEGARIMMGNRSGHQDETKIIDYVTRKELRDKYPDGEVVIRNNREQTPAE